LNELYRKKTKKERKSFKRKGKEKRKKGALDRAEKRTTVKGGCSEETPIRRKRQKKFPKKRRKREGQDCGVKGSGV